MEELIEDLHIIADGFEFNAYEAEDEKVENYYKERAKSVRDAICIVEKAEQVMGS